jgi:putative membrane protein insertion efficiency factor
MRPILLGVIWLYQRTLSPDHGPLKALFPGGFCRFYPSCSVYGREAVRRFGVLRGGVLAIKRLLRCNPFSKGGVDLVPDQKQRD